MARLCTLQPGFTPPAHHLRSGPRALGKLPAVQGGTHVSTARWLVQGPNSDLAMGKQKTADQVTNSSPGDTAARPWKGSPEKHTRPSLYNGLSGMQEPLHLRLITDPTEEGLRVLTVPL